MGKFVNIKDNDFESTLCEFLDPDLVYVPYDKSYKLCIKDGDKVCFNDAILKSDSNTIYSPISGEIKGATKMICDGEYRPCIVIENDFEERKRRKVKTCRIYSYITIMPWLIACPCNLLFPLWVP